MGLLLGGDEIDIVCDEELPDPGDGPAPRRDKGRFAKVRAPILFFQLGLKTLILPSSDLRIKEEKGLSNKMQCTNIKRLCSRYAFE